MEDRHFYTGFVNDRGTRSREGLPKWKMADWLIEKLDEIVELGYQEDSRGSGYFALGYQRESFTNKKQRVTKIRLRILSLGYQRGELCWNKKLNKTIEDRFDRDWIIEFRRSMPPMIGLIWGGSSREQAKRGRLRQKQG